MEGDRQVITTYKDNSIPPDSIDFNFINHSNRVGNSLKLGADYSITDHLIINGEINYDQHLHNGVNTQTLILPNPGTKKINEVDFNNNYDIEGFFDINQTFENPDQEFNFAISYDYQKDNERESLRSDTTTLYQNINGINIDISYKHPLNEISIVELGYDGKINDNTENMDFEIEDFSGNNTFGYNRTIHGFFLEYDYKISEKFSIKPSMRYEYISKDISFKSVTSNMASGSNRGGIPEEVEINTSNLYARILSQLDDSNYVDNYSTFYPDLHFTYNITEKQSLQFGLSKRVNRPGDGGHGGGSRQIRPFPRDVYTDNFIFMGNPFLKPEYSTQYELSFKTPLPMGFGYVNVYYHQLENVIEWYDDDRFDDADILTFRNAASGENMGVEVFTMLWDRLLGVAII